MIEGDTGEQTPGNKSGSALSDFLRCNEASTSGT